jgi:hypothetical protein
MQGKSRILALPVQNNKLYFFRMYQPPTPFGFEGDFTDDRYALIVT